MQAKNKGTKCKAKTKDEELRCESAEVGAQSAWRTKGTECKSTGAQSAKTLTKKGTECKAKAKGTECKRRKGVIKEKGNAKRTATNSTGEGYS